MSRTVFEAVVDPKQLTGYFLQASTGPLTPGATVMWKFAEHPDTLPVTVREVVEGRSIVILISPDG